MPRSTGVPCVLQQDPDMRISTKPAYHPLPMSPDEHLSKQSGDRCDCLPQALASTLDCDNGDPHHNVSQGAPPSHHFSTVSALQDTVTRSGKLPKRIPDVERPAHKLNPSVSLLKSPAAQVTYEGLQEQSRPSVLEYMEATEGTQPVPVASEEFPTEPLDAYSATELGSLKQKQIQLDVTLGERLEERSLRYMYKVFACTAIYAQRMSDSIG